MGAFIVIEGSDGTGKSTQVLKLDTRAHRHGYNVMHATFPNYGARSAKFTEHYLNGRYGPARSVHPELASMVYAIDRFSMRDAIREHLRKPHSIVIADRYVASNLAHQGTKYADKENRETFYETIFELEFDILDLPKPDLNIILEIPTTMAIANIEKRIAESPTPIGKDQHEKDVLHLKQAQRNYREIAKIYPEWYERLSCVEPDKVTMRPIQDIGDDIWELVLPILQDRAS
jgi:dTMP kinase